MKIIWFALILQFTDGSTNFYNNQQFDTLRDCVKYQRLFDVVAKDLVGQYVEDKDNNINKEIQHVSSVCKVQDLDKNTTEEFK